MKAKPLMRCGAEQVPHIKPAATPAVLSPCRAEVLDMIGRGMKPMEIARARCRSIKTIQFQIKELQRLLHCRDRVALAIYAVRHGLTSGGNT